MPALAPPAKVLVSGASGYVATWVVQSLLERGFSVRGAVRSLEKGAHLKKTFERYGDKLELVVVEDIAKDGAFDQAVKGVDAIAHTASPFHTHADDPQELIVPAINGTLGILKSALAHGGSSLKRIIITSSTVSINSPGSTIKPVFTEADWNDPAIQAVEQQGRNADGLVKYEASKTLAEKAAWDFYNQHKGSIGWDLVVLNPPWVFGPVLHEVHDPSALNTSAAVWYYSIYKRAQPTPGALPTWIDVRDLAEAHARAIEREDVGGERILVVASTTTWQTWLDAADSKSAHIPDRSTAPQQYDTSKGDGLLQIRYRSVEETTKDCFEDFKARGW